jgi:hypothetical protein
MEALVQLLTPLIIDLVGEYRHRNDELTSEIVRQRLMIALDSTELKINQLIADIRNKK